MAEESGQVCGDEEVELWVAVAVGTGQWFVGDAGYAESDGWKGGERGVE